MSIEPLAVPSAADWADALSPRELDVAMLVSQGLSNRAVAQALGLAESTVKIHLHSVYRKLGAANRYALLLQARKNVQQSA